MDDVEGQCDQGPYPLLHAAAGVFDLHGKERSRTKTIDSPDSAPQSKHILCSVSFNPETPQQSSSFSLDKIDSRLCTHLLIDAKDPRLTPSTSEHLKSANPSLKILLTVASSNASDLKPVRDEIDEKHADGINILIDEPSKDLSEKIQVDCSPSRSSLFTRSLH